MTNFGLATNYARLAARFNPLPNGRGAKITRAGRVIQVGFGGQGTVRMTVEDARDFARGLMEMASPMLPHQILVVKYLPPGCRHHRRARVTAGEVLPFAAAVLRACREAEAGTLFQGVRG